MIKSRLLSIAQIFVAAALWLSLGLGLPAARAQGAAPAFRPPAVPLLTYDPYLNIWADCTYLADFPTRDWAGNDKNLVSLIRIDGKSYRLMGGEPGFLPELRQESVKVWPLESVYHFAGHGVALTLTFLTPRLPDNLAAFGRPVTYIIWKVASTDGQAHRVQIYYSTSASLAALNGKTQVTGEKTQIGNLVALKVGAANQQILQSAPPSLSWGYIYTAAPANQTEAALANNTACQQQFLQTGGLPATSMSAPERIDAGHPVEALAFDLGKVAATPVSCHALVALDEQDCVNLNGTPLKPYWRHDTPTAGQMLQTAQTQYAGLKAASEAFDHKVWASCAAIGGQKYATICALAYRQAIGMMGMAEDAHGQPLLFTDENTSGGDIATVDVIYPAAPMFLLFNPDLMKAMLVPVFQFCASKYWPQPYAIHDLGKYPNAMGHIHGGGETMPVEESANMILLTAAIAHAEGGKHGFADEYWSYLTRWAGYLVRNGFDPGNQLCTDDFAGPMAHNANLSIKAIEAIGAYGYLCGLRGDSAEAAKYMAMAKRWARHWMEVDASKDGTHYRLGFKTPHSWSQKYNLIWDRVLGLNLFPKSVRQKELDYYMTRMEVFGLPLDDRKLYTKTDWSLWTASLDPGSRYFHTIVNHVYRFLDRTPSRVGLSDFYWTVSGRNAGMYARPVVGAMYITMLTDSADWRQWAGQGQRVRGDWAPLPKPPKVTVVVPAADKQPAVWSYTTQKPPADWMDPGFNDSSWKRGRSGFGSPGTPGAIIGTIWKTDNIWLRREVNLPSGNYDDIEAWMHHDEGDQVYINGVLALKTTGYINRYSLFTLTPQGEAALKPGKNLIAIHCHQTVGGQYVDLGLVDVERR